MTPIHEKENSEDATAIIFKQQVQIKFKNIHSVPLLSSAFDYIYSLVERPNSPTFELHHF